MPDLSSIIQFLALGGFLAGAAGVAMVVTAASQNRPVQRGVALAVGGVVVGIFLLIVSQGLLIVQPTQRAVVFNTVSGQLENPRDPGISIVIPGIQQVTMYPVSQQNYTMSDTDNAGGRFGADAISARSVDGQEVRLDMTLLFRLEEDLLNEIHTNWSAEPGGYLDGLIRPTVRSVVRDVVATFEAEAIYGIGREDMQTEIDARLTNLLGEEGIQVTDTLVRDVNFSTEFITSIEAKQVEEQELQRAVTAAERVRTEARGRAEAAIEEARGEAEAIRVRAEAEAEALRLISAQIAANPNLIQYTYIQELGDNVSLALVPSNSPFLFDFESLSGNALGEDFVPPENPETQSFLPPEPEDESSTGE